MEGRFFHEEALIAVGELEELGAQVGKAADDAHGERIVGRVEVKGSGDGVESGQYVLNFLPVCIR